LQEQNEQVKQNELVKSWLDALEEIKKLGVNPYPVTPGLKIARLTKLRPFSGKSVIGLVSITWPMLELSDSSSGAEPVTSTVSLTAPTSRPRSMRAVWLTSSRTLSRETVRKPTGLLYISERVHEKLQPGLAHGLFAYAEPSEGWVKYLGDPGLTPFVSLPLAPDARRFEIHGMPKTLGTAGLAESLAYVNSLNAQDIVDHIIGLSDFLIEELTRRGITVWTPSAAHLRSGIVTCEPFPCAEQVHQLDQALQAQKIYPTVRYCSGIGGLRISIHYYTGREDLEALLAALDEEMRRIRA
jgi:hypothetical protein